MSDYDAFRKIINHEANQEDDGGFFAKLYGFQPEHDDQGPTARGLFQHMHRDVERSGPAVKWPARGRVSPGYFNRGGHIRTCVVWKIPNLIGIDILARSFWNKIPWRWYCRKCPASGAKPSWKLAYESANHHVRNHHRSGK